MRWQVERMKAKWKHRPAGEGPWKERRDRREVQCRNKRYIRDGKERTETYKIEEDKAAVEGWNGGWKEDGRRAEQAADDGRRRGRAEGVGVRACDSFTLGLDFRTRPRLSMTYQEKEMSE